MRTETFMQYDGPIRIVGVAASDGMPVHGTLEHGTQRKPVMVAPGLEVPWAWTLKLDRTGIGVSFVEGRRPAWLPEFG